MISKVELVVLGSLSDEPRYGYQLLERFRERGMQAWAEVGRASVYQALDRLEARGMVTGRDVSGSAGPGRRVYQLTAAGRARLREGLLERFAEGSPYETAGGAALGFLGALEGPQRRRALADHAAAIRAHRQTIDVMLGEVTDRNDRALLERQGVLADAELSWLQRSRTALGR
jgi:DNA-binding PadR family transcriptional regulator